MEIRVKGGAKEKGEEEFGIQIKRMEEERKLESVEC